MREDAVELHVEGQEPFAALTAHYRGADFARLGIDLFHPAVVEVVADGEVNLVGQCREFGRGVGAAHAFVAFQEAGGDPLGVRQRGMRLAHRFGEPIDLNGRVGRQIEAAGRPAHVLACGHSAHRFEEFADALTDARRSPHHRNAQAARERAEVDLDVVARGLIDEVDAQHRAVGDLQHLQHHVHVALQARGVGHHHRHIGLTEEDEVAGDFLVFRGRGQRIGAGQVDDAITLVAEVEEALGLAHGLARPVAGVLFQPRQAVENGALARVRVAGEGHDIARFAPRLAVAAQGVERSGGTRGAGAVWEGGCGGRSGVFHSGVTMIWRACSRRNAMAVPRTT